MEDGDGINRQKTNEYSRFIHIRITKNNGQHSSDAPHAIIELRLENHRNPSVDLRSFSSRTIRPNGGTPLINRSNWP